MPEPKNDTVTDEAPSPPEIRAAFAQLAGALLPAPGVDFRRLVARRRRRRRGAAAVAVAGCLAAIGAGFSLHEATTRPTTALPAARASATPDGAPVSSVTEAEFSAFEEQVTSVARPEPNFTGITVDLPSRTLTIYGVGDASQPVADILGQAPAGIDAAWVPSPYSREQLDRAQHAIDNVIPRLVSIQTNDTYTALIAGVATDLTPDRIQQLARLAAQATDIPVRFVHAAPASVAIAPG